VQKRGRELFHQRPGARPSYDTDLYKERHRIEPYFNELKQFHPVATPFGKLLVNFTGFVKRAAIAIWVK
jgi:putative transposase